MKKIFLGDYLLVFLVKIVGSIFRIIPVGLAFFIARRIGEISGLLNQKRYRIAYANLKAALGRQYTPRELKRILRRTYANIGQGVMEVLLLPKIDDRYIKKYIQFENFHIAEEALKKGKGFIFLTAHFGTWEVSHVALPSIGFAYKGIAREQKPYLLNELLNKYRESGGCKILLKGPAIKEALRALRSNGIVGMLVDQDAGKEGIFVDLFKRRASWHRGVMEMAIKTGAAVIPGFAIRQKGPRIMFKCFDPIKFPVEGDNNIKAEEGFKQYTAVLERVISQHPDQWLWQHRRWKSTPTRKIMILDDMRTGHLRQSQAVVKILKDIWQQKGYHAEDIRVKILNKDSRIELMKTYADIIISCGASTAALNLLLAKENNAKSIVIMKPSLVSLKKFDLAIIPYHDNPPRLDNVAMTDGALNMVDKARKEFYKKKLIERIGPLNEKVIGLLIGGSTKNFSMDDEAISSLLDNIIRSANEQNAQILLSTSRRTPNSVEDLIKRRLRNEPRCRLLVVANESNMEGAVEGISGLSDIILVSEESISMVSEAASSGSYAVVFTQGGNIDKRHNLFLQHLSQKGYIKIAGVENIYSTISDVFENNLQQPVLNDAVKVKEALDKLL